MGSVRCKYVVHYAVIGCICAVLFITWKISQIHSTLSYDFPTKVLIIDPGHGGVDGGAVGINGVIESEINLDIALKLKALCHLYGIPIVMTRETMDIAYPEQADTISKKKIADQNQRLRLIRDTPNGILFSIHQNCYPSATPYGPEVLYGHSEGDREVGELLQQNLQDGICPSSRRVAAEISNDIFLLRECKCTAILIECGFLSNPNDAKLLQTQEYQTKIATILLGSYLQFTNR